MKERLQTLSAYLDFKRPLLQVIRRFRPSESLALDVLTSEKNFDTDPASAEYLAGIYFAPGELDEDYLNEPKKSAILQFAARFGKDIIHLPAKPKGRVLIGVGVAAMLITGAKIIYDHHAKNSKSP